MAGMQAAGALVLRVGLPARAAGRQEAAEAGPSRLGPTAPARRPRWPDGKWAGSAGSG